MKSSLFSFCFTSLLACFASTVSADVVIFQDETAFNADLQDPTNFGSAGVDFHGGSDIAGLTSHTTSPVVINGMNYSFTFSEGVFDTSLGGTATDATAATTVGAIDTSGSDFRYEAGTTDQGGASIPAWGYDTDASASNSANTVALFDFTGSPTDVFTFALTAGDFEGGNAWSNVVAAYRPDGSLIDEISFDFPAPAYGDGTEEFVGFGASEPLGYVAFFVGEDDPTGFGHTERIAIGDFKLGTSALSTVAIPEPSSFGLAILGLGGLIARRRRS